MNPEMQFMYGLPGQDLQYEKLNERVRPYGYGFGRPWWGYGQPWGWFRPRPWIWVRPGLWGWGGH
ncbi:hypothetical protein [Mesobacillus zeae]|uniref:Uncharacterized protein n=1 Tax=Mesobacillus zeae TaxID=1917180 RepID=A0A398BDN4_9BACI|nr:hypothetical protein [Mesobacillus zeae]RID88285.1 hypothetical protein D1970_01935 [Mesobacillus zeae]